MTQSPSPDQPPYGTPPQPPYGAPAPHAPQAPQVYGAQPQQPYGPPQADGAPPQPAYGPPAPYGTQPQQPYGTPPQPHDPGMQAYVGTPPGYGAPPAGSEQPPGAVPPTAPAGPGGVVAHHAYDRAEVPRGTVLPSSRPPRRASGWNAPAFGLLALGLALVGLIVWPQLRARKTEAAVKPLVGALSQRAATARCPRYLTSVLTNVGSVSLDDTGRIADRTDLTGPVCDGLRHFYSPGGKQELSCLTSGSSCSHDALVSVVALSVVVHESMHLRGQLDEGRAECESIGESQTLARSLGIPLDQARMISWLHYAGMNPNTPPQYQISPADCRFVAELEAAPPSTPQARDALAKAVNRTWTQLAS